MVDEAKELPTGFAALIDAIGEIEIDGEEILDILNHLFTSSVIVLLFEFADAWGDLADDEEDGLESGGIHGFRAHNVMEFVAAGFFGTAKGAEFVVGNGIFESKNIDPVICDFEVWLFEAIELLDELFDVLETGGVNSARKVVGVFQDAGAATHAVGETIDVVESGKVENFIPALATGKRGEDDNSRLITFFHLFNLALNFAVLFFDGKLFFRV